MKTLKILLLVLAVICCKTVVAQVDSLSHFDRMACIRTGISEGLHGEVLRNYIARQERNFLIDKFELKRQRVYKEEIPQARLTNCAGSDFETDAVAAVTASAQLVAWTANDGYNSSISSPGTSTMLPYYPGGLSGANSCNLVGCCPLPPSSSSVVSSTSVVPLIDPQIGIQYPIYSVFGTNTVSGANAANPQLNQIMRGERFLKLGNELTGDYSMSRVYKAFPITQSNSLLSYAFVFLTAPGHPCCDAASINFRVWNASTNSLIPNLCYALSPQASQCNSSYTVPFYVAGTGALYTGQSNANQVYTKWQINQIDLSPYMGQVIVFEAIVTDCTAGGHYGKAYFDAECSDLSIVTTTAAVGQDPLCAGMVTLTAVPAINSAIWYGPNNFSVAASTCMPPVSGIYSLTLFNGLNTTISRTVQVQMAPLPTVFPDTICKYVNSTINVSGALTYTWSTGTIDMPTNFMSAVALSTIGIVGTGTNSCPFSFTTTIAAVIDSIKLFPKDTLICRWNSAVLHAGPAQIYNWSSGGNSSTVVVSPTVNTTYFMNGTTVHGCNYSDSVLVRVQKCIGVEEGITQLKQDNRLVFLTNPAHRSLNCSLRSSEIIESVTIFDQQAKRLAHHIVNKVEVEIPVSGFACGTYFIEIQLSTKTITEKLIIVD